MGVGSQEFPAPYPNRPKSSHGDVQMATPSQQNDPAFHAPPSCFTIKNRERRAAFSSDCSISGNSGASRDFVDQADSRLHMPRCRSLQ